MHKLFWLLKIVLRSKLKSGNRRKQIFFYVFMILSLILRYILQYIGKQCKNLCRINSINVVPNLILNNKIGFFNKLKIFYEKKKIKFKSFVCFFTNDMMQFDQKNESKTKFI